MTYPPEPLASVLDVLHGSVGQLPSRDAIGHAHSWLVRGQDPHHPSDPRAATRRGSLDDALPALEDLVWLRLEEVAAMTASPHESSATTAAGLSMLAAAGSPLVVVIGADEDGVPTVTAGVGRHPGIAEAWRANQAPDAIWTPTPHAAGLAVALKEHQQTAMSCRARSATRQRPADGGPTLPSALQLLLHSAASLRSWCVVFTLRPLDPRAVKQVAARTDMAARHFARAVTVTDTTGETRSFSGTDSSAQQVVDSVEAWCSMLDDADAGGGWDVGTYCCAARAQDLRVVAGLLKALLGSNCARSQEDRLWNWNVDPVEPGGPVGGSWLSSRDVADLLLPPSTSVGALQVRQHLAGGRRTTAHPRPLLLGEWAGTRIPASIDVSDLNGHGFVTGMTGSGKSTSTRSVLTQLWNDHGIPFLVIDPAKADYPALAPHLYGGMTVVDGGDLSMNALAPWPGYPQERHVTAVASAFRAAFGLPMPVPYVAALLFDEVAAVDGVTLHDVSARLPSLITELGYRGEIEGNIRASLGLRLRLLTQPTRADRLTGVGPPTWLTERPTVVQLGDLADEEERAFISALLVIWVAEAARTRGESRDLRHLTVLEEAHRLMPEPRPNGGEEGDAGAVSARLMTQLLAEIRSYGESVLVIDQSPAAVAREVVRNTNVKLVHRVVDHDDQVALGGSMGLPEEDSRMLGSLNVGRALLSTRDLMTPQTLQVTDRLSGHHVDDLPVSPQDGRAGPQGPPPSPAARCHAAGGEITHHSSERLGDAMEFEVALWAQAGGGRLLLDRARLRVAESPGTSVGCLMAVGIRRHVATLARLGLVPHGGEAQQVTEWWAAATRGEHLPTPHPGDDAVAPMPSCRRCPARCRARALVASGVLPGLDRHRGAIRSAATPATAADLVTMAVGGYLRELAPALGDDAALATAYCAGAHLAHDAGVTTTWLDEKSDGRSS